MRDSPRDRRLRSDYRALLALRGESTIFDFAVAATGTDRPPEQYVVRFHGPSFALHPDTGQVMRRDVHDVQIQLGASYPRQMPDLRWNTPIYHPNISQGGMVCLGGYSHHWVPSLSLDALCEMLWDMLRLRNFDVRSPYNREAACWLSAQTHLTLPLDARPLRDRLAADTTHHQTVRRPTNSQVVLGEVVEAEVVSAVESPRPEITFLDS